MFKEYEVKFKYADSYSRWCWRNQECTLEARNEQEAKEKCMKLYGLGVDCDYQIVSVKEI